MCIRDRPQTEGVKLGAGMRAAIASRVPAIGLSGLLSDLSICLLYTSDAADERSSVDLGGRRIIKKKNDIVNHIRVSDQNSHQTRRHQPRTHEKSKQRNYDSELK